MAYKQIPGDATYFHTITSGVNEMLLFWSLKYIVLRISKWVYLRLHVYYIWEAIVQNVIQMPI